MSVIGIEEIFLRIEDMEKALAFRHELLGIPLDKRTCPTMDRGHIVLQPHNHAGRHLCIQTTTRGNP